MRKLVGSCLTLGLLASGCANHVRFVETERDRESVTPLESRHAIRAPEDLVSAPDVRIQLVRAQTLEIRRERSFTRSEERTPYRGARELWEVPSGLVSVPLSLLFNVTDVLLLGSVPNERVYGSTHWAFAALNPALNVEDAARIERRELQVRRQTLDSRREVKDTPLIDAALHVALDEGAVRVLRSDAEGAVSLHLIELIDAELPWPPRRVRLELRSDDGVNELAASGFFLERELAQRLASAAPLLAVRNLVDPSAEQWSAAVYGLDRLGFRTLSAELHDLAFQRWASAPERIERFRQRLDALHASGSRIEALPASADDSSDIAR